MGMKGFTPLEANPDVFKSYAEALGRRNLVFQDVFAFEDWAFDMLKKPIVGLIAIVPLTDNIIKWRRTQYPTKKVPETTSTSGVWFTVQNVSNACGTIALLHLLNNVNTGENVDENSSLGQIRGSTLNNSPQEKGKFIENSKQIKELHTKFQSKGDTDAPPVGALVDTHFITFVVVEGNLYELDGMLTYPVNHGPSSQEDLLTHAAKVIRTNFMELEPEDMRFSAIAVSLGN